MNVRVRFAPSPTGFLHIGGARTALFNWLYARHTGGTFILRIEDTDTARNTRPAVDVILEALRWLGLDWDEGPLSSDPAGPAKGAHGPYFQSQRRAVYQRHVDRLLARDRAYVQDGVVKFRMTREPIVIDDLIVGPVRRELTDREALDPDFILGRSDGQPVFHLVNVVDDLEMGITHVIRGEDHLSNTAKHLALFRALDAPPPRYAHIPLILNADGTKMSKRDVGASLTTYMEEGYLPEALVNYLVLLGWSPKEDREIFSVPELIERFDLPQVLRHNARFDMTKLQWMNGEYLRALPPERFYALAFQTLQRAGVDLGRFPSDFVRAALETCRGKLRTLAELPGYGGFYFTGITAYEPETATRHFVPENRPRLQRLREALAAAPSFDAATLEGCLKATATALGVKPAVLVHPLRLACTGRSSGPSLYHLMEVLGRDETLARLDAALARF